MKLVKFQITPPTARVGLWEGDCLVPLDLPRASLSSLADLLESDRPHEQIAPLALRDQTVPVTNVQLLPPIDQQEVWAAGVTYTRSKTARMEESETAASCYDRVYVADRPELFLKATPHRVVGTDQPIRIRRDATWNVPEPELTLVLNSQLKLVGFTIGNDMSSRDIEGDNPLYLPQAKVYSQSCGIGPCIVLAESLPDAARAQMHMQVVRGAEVCYSGFCSVAQMARTFDELIAWLGRDNTFPHGVLLMTGTGIVPDSSFTLLPGDVVEITVDGIGTLRNPVVQG